MNVILSSFRATYHAALSPSIFNHSGRLSGLVTRFAVLAVLACAAWHGAAAQTKPATTTALAVTSGGSTVTTISAGSVVTLTASVEAGAAAVTTGQVNFCDATAKYCTDIHRLGTAQLTSSGTATLKLRPGIGSHSYKAIFVGTNSYAPSASSPSTLAVTGTTGQFASTTTISESGSWGAYTLGATVTEVGGTAAPTGTVSFLDTSNGNALKGAGALGAATAGLSWLSVQSSGLSIETTLVVVGDFNGDGIPDLAAANSGLLTILLGNGDGTFAAAASSPVVSFDPSAIAVGDFNGDGIEDLAVANSLNNTVVILLGHGDGTFTAAASSPATGVEPAGLAVGDFNGDGIADLAVVNGNNSGSGTLTILLGNGDGSFTAAPGSPAVGDDAYAIVAGDFNGDGKMDLAVTNLFDENLTILLGNGDGTFTAAASPAVTSYCYNIASADFNGDGVPDLVVGCKNEGLVTVLLGNGDGTFTAATASPGLGFGGSGLAVADFNEDGIPDVAVLDYSSSSGVHVFLGNGDGTFVQSPVIPPAGYFPSVLVAADFNVDGRPDLAVSGNSSTGSFVYLTEPTETAIATANISLSGVGQHLVDASYPGDGNYKPSVSGTTPLWGSLPATSTNLTITSGDTPVTSVAPGTAVTLTATVTAGASPVTAGQVDFCDASATECTDIHVLGTVALTSSGTASFKFVPGPGTHSYKAMFVEDGYGMSSSSAAVSLTVGPAKSIVYSDTTAISASGSPGDYSLTATVVGYGGSASPTGSVSFLDTSFGNTLLGTAPLGPSTAGVGWLISQTPAASNNPIAELSGDFNGDGIPDLALLWSANAYSGPPSATILFGKGDGTFTSGPTVQVTGAQEDPSMIAGDFNGDGKMDLAVLSWDGDTTSYITTLMGHGDGTFTVMPTSPVFDQGSVGGDFIQGSMVAADFNGDGKLDLAVVGDYVSSGGVTILLGNGDGTFKAPGPNTLPNHGFGLVAAGDFNGDGIPDLVAVDYFEDNNGKGSATVLLGNGDGTFASVPSFEMWDFPKAVVVGDFNGDKVPDLAFGFNSGGGTQAVLVFLGKGDGTFSAGPAVTGSASGISLVAGDFNHDGILDLAGIDSYHDQIDLFIGAGDGTFTATATTPAVSQSLDGPFAIVAADFNGDGVPDLAMLTNYVNTASILLTEPTQTATATVNGIAPVGAGTHNVEASYPGDGNYPASASTPVALTAGLAPLVITPAAGSYSTKQTITIKESIPGATIYYSASGALNTNGFVVYTAPIQLTEGGSETIEAYATETGYEQTGYAVASFTINLPAAPTPIFSPVAGSYPSAQTVTISDSAAGATIYYTTNGSQPTTASAVYSAPITVSSSETLVAVAFASGYSVSAPAVAQYLNRTLCPARSFTQLQVMEALGIRAMADPPCLPI